MNDRRRNPWLGIAAAEYEAHMAEVGQSAALREIFRRAYSEARPPRLLVLGCGTGEDLAAVDPAVTGTCVGVDVNRGYLDLARARLDRRGGSAELVPGDVLTVDLPAGGFDLVYAALILEYVDPAGLFSRIRDWLAPGGTGVTVTQNPAPGIPSVSRTGHAALQVLEEGMTLRDAGEIDAIARTAGLTRTAVREVELPGGKSFSVASFVGESGGRPGEA